MSVYVDYMKYDPPTGATHITYNKYSYHTYGYFKKIPDTPWKTWHPTWNEWVLANMYNIRPNELWRLKCEKQ
jgi:hypothetical protein